MKKYNFSNKHWGIILFGFLMFFFYNACTSDGMNVIVPELAAQRGWDYKYVLSFASVGGCISVVGQLFMGRMCKVKGAKFTILVNLIGGAIFFFLYGHAVSIPMYVIALFGVVTCSSAYAYIGGSALIANWFPAKKGIAAGMTSMGVPFSTAVSVAIFTFLFQRAGFETTMTAVSIILAVFAVICALAIHDMPEQCGAWPDNEPPENDAGSGAEQTEVMTEKGMTLKEMLHQKKMWIVAVIFGLNSMATLGIMGQFVIRHQELGIPHAAIMIMLTGCAVIGIAGSAVMGNLEHRLGSTKAFCACALFLIAGLLLNFTGNIICVILSIVCFGMGLTGTQVFLTTFLVTIFGRKNFSAAYAIAYPVSSLLCQLCFLLNAASLTLFGEIRFSYLFFVVLMVLAMILALSLRLDKKS